MSGVAARCGDVRELPGGKLAVYADELDIHLSPKIGFDWLLSGQPKDVIALGQNAKHYLAGANDARMGWSIGSQAPASEVGWSLIGSKVGQGLFRIVNNDFLTIQ